MYNRKREMPTEISIFIKIPVTGSQSLLGIFEQLGEPLNDPSSPHSTVLLP